MEKSEFVSEAIPNGDMLKTSKEGYESMCVNCRKKVVTRNTQWVHKTSDNNLCYPESE
jgi:hypothetical protein